MVLTIIEIICAIGIPLLIMKLRQTRVISGLGVTGSSYLAGIIFALIVWILSITGVVHSRGTSVIEIICYLSVSLGIPLLLFSSNLRYIGKLSKKAVLAFLLLIISVFLVSLATFLLFGRNIDNSNILSGMAAALYTGGTPNSNAVGYIYGLSSSTILIANISDIIIGGIFYAFLIFLSKPFLAKILKSSDTQTEALRGTFYDESLKVKFSLRSKGVVRNILIALGFVILSALIGVLIWFLAGSKDGTLTNFIVPALMIGTTVLGIAFSFVPSVRDVRENNLAGQYFTAIFSFSIASMLNFSAFSQLSIRIFGIFAIITVGTFILHMIFCKIFKIGADLMIVSSTAGIYGPAFIPSVSKAIGAEYLLPVGLILGSFGYAIGTFFGIGFIEFIGLICGR